MDTDALDIPYYESDKGLGEYLLFHFGADEICQPHASGPTDGLRYPQRCVDQLLDRSSLPASARALDAGCAVGASTFELAKHCTEVIGFDLSQRFIEAAQALQTHGRLRFEYTEEGGLTSEALAAVDGATPRDRVRFEVADACDFGERFGTFDVILAANLIDRTPRPRAVLEHFKTAARPGAQLLITSPYTWLPEYTDPEQWLGGYTDSSGPVSTLEGMRRVLEPTFELVKTEELPFLIREHRRKFQWSVAQGSLWRRVS